MQLDPSIRRMAELIDEQIVPRVNVFRTLQDPDGHITHNHDQATTLLAELRAPVRQIYGQLSRVACAEAFEADLDNWLGRGLSELPQFDQTLRTYIPPAPDSPTFFIAPFTATNGVAPRGMFLECFLALREEPAELNQVMNALPHPKNGCQSGRLIIGSTGVMRGNCIVFFPENVAAAEKVTEQTFALFFFNKFQRIYLGETIPRVNRLFGDRGWRSVRMTPAECYRARCLWGYLHDYFHHCGPRPFDTNLRIKMNFFVGLLEEIKVDSQSAVAAATRNIPFGHEIVEFILFERMLRYPGQPDASNNFDAGTGLLLFEWLIQNGYGLRAADGGLDIELAGCIAGMDALAQQIEEIETEADNNLYRRQAKEFVRSLLPEGSPGTRFAVPPRYAELTQISAGETPPLDFTHLPY